MSSSYKHSKQSLHTYNHDIYLLISQKNNQWDFYFYSIYRSTHLTDSTTLTIMYMAVSMVINILTTIPLVSLLILNVDFLSFVEG